MRACGSPCMHFVLHSSGLMFSFLIGRSSGRGSGGGAFLHFFIPLGVACWVVSFVLRVSAMASPAAWCLCRWVSRGVSGVVGGSSLGAFNYLDDFSTFNNY